MKPRIWRQGGYWVCRLPDSFRDAWGGPDRWEGIGLTPRQAYMDWQYR